MTELPGCSSPGACSVEGGNLFHIRGVVSPACVPRRRSGPGRGDSARALAPPSPAPLTTPSTIRTSVAATTAVASTTIRGTSSTRPAAASAPCEHSQLDSDSVIRSPSQIGREQGVANGHQRRHRALLLVGLPDDHAMYDRNRTVLTFVYTHTGDMVVTARPPSHVDLTPGFSAFASINKFRCDLGRDRKRSRSPSIAPGDPTPLTIALLVQYVALDFCGPGDPGSVVAVAHPSPRAFRPPSTKAPASGAP